MKNLAIKTRQGGLFALVLTLLAACGGGGSSSTAPGAGGGSAVAYVEPAPKARVVTPAFAPQAGSDSVVLTQNAGAYLFRQVAYTTNSNGGIASMDSAGNREDSFTTHTLENAYIKATLLPGYGGRIISLINKSTGKEALYQNPLGLPYSVGQGAFVYDWLQILGGIFPTFGPEHGKAWNRPWSFSVVEETPQQVSIKMSWTDDFTLSRVPANFGVYTKASGLRVDYLVTLKAGRAALDTRLEIHNDTSAAQTAEYWVNVGLAPGSTVGDAKATAGAEIITPGKYVNASWCAGEARCQKTLANAKETSKTDSRFYLGKVYELNTLNFYKNWTDWGIFYAYNSESTWGLANHNFWGVINHDNEEGLIRIADNQATFGMKYWTFGYETSKDMTETAMRSSANRPFIELWAGTSPVFFGPTPLASGQMISQAEVYAPSVGLGGVSHANDNFLVNLRSSGSQALASVTSLNLGLALDYTLYQGDSEIGAGSFTPSASASSELAATLPSGATGALRLVIRRAGSVVFDSNAS